MGNHTNHDIERLALAAAFVAVADQLSFAKASILIGISTSTLSRKIAKLEDSLGFKLFERNTRRIALTEIGLIYYERCKEALANIDDTDEMIASMNGDPRGLLRISLPVAFGRIVMPNIISDFVRQNPRVQVEVAYTDRFVDLIEEGFNAVVRIGNLPDSTLIARKIGSNRRRLIASADYISRNGLPAKPADLVRHNCLCFRHHSHYRTLWNFQRGNDVDTVEVKGDFSSDNSESLNEAILRGMGVGIIANYICQKHIASGELVDLLPEWTLVPESQIYIVYGSSKYLLPKTRAFINCVVESMRNAD